MASKEIEYWAEYELSDPAHFDPLIADQKKRLKANPENPQAWVKLGNLYDSKVSMTNSIVSHSLLLRFIQIPVLLFFFLFALIIYKIGPRHFFLIDNPLLMVPLVLGAGLIQAGILYIRFPKSGSFCFKKAIALDQNCGEAYMNLGFIALRRHQKRKAYRLLEQALRLKVDDKRLKKELRSNYEKEFLKFFNARQSENKKKEEEIINQQEQIKKLQAEIHLHKTNIAILKAKTKQTLSHAKQNIKLKSKELDSQISDVKKDYQEKIAEIEQEKAALEKEKEVEPVIFVNLSDELFESELKTEQLSFHQTVEKIKNVVELDLWQSLSRQAKYYVVTAEQAFSIFSKSADIKDFSLIGLEYCKALELEINKRFVFPFKEKIKDGKKEFLRLDQIGEKQNKPKYASYLSMVIDEENYPEINSLTLGQFHYVLNQSLKSNYCRQEFRQFLIDLFSGRDEAFPNLFLNNLGIVVKRYRNVIAHQSSMSKVECDHLRDLIFLGEHSLLRICSTC